MPTAGEARLARASKQARVMSKPPIRGRNKNYNKENVGSPVNKSKIPLTSRKSTKLNKARPVPDFGKMHRKWADTLEKGKACVKKPCTVPQAFDLALSGSKIQRARTTTENDDPPLSLSGGQDDEGLDFAFDQKSLNNIMNTKGVRENMPADPPLSGGRGKVKRRIFGELPTTFCREKDTRQKETFDSLAENQADFDIAFESDDSALASILNNTGIQNVVQAPPAVKTRTPSSRFTSSGKPSMARKAAEEVRRSIYVQPSKQRTKQQSGTQGFRDCFLSRMTLDGLAQVTSGSTAKSAKPTASSLLASAKAPLQSRNSIYQSFDRRTTLTTRRNQMLPPRTPATASRVPNPQARLTAASPAASPAMRQQRKVNQTGATPRSIVKWADILSPGSSLPKKDELKQALFVDEESVYHTPSVSQPVGRSEEVRERHEEDVTLKEDLQKLKDIEKLEKMLEQEIEEMELKENKKPSPRPAPSTPNPQIAVTSPVQQQSPPSSKFTPTQSPAPSPTRQSPRKLAAGPSPSLSPERQSPLKIRTTQSSPLTSGSPRRRSPYAKRRTPTKVQAEQAHSTAALESAALPYEELEARVKGLEEERKATICDGLEVAPPTPAAGTTNEALVLKQLEMIKKQQEELNKLQERLLKGLQQQSPMPAPSAAQPPGGRSRNYDLNIARTPTGHQINKQKNQQQPQITHNVTIVSKSPTQQAIVAQEKSNSADQSQPDSERVKTSPQERREINVVGHDNVISKDTSINQDSITSTLAKDSSDVPAGCVTGEIVVNAQEKQGISASQQEDDQLGEVVSMKRLTQTRSLSISPGSLQPYKLLRSDVMSPPQWDPADASNTGRTDFLVHTPTDEVVKSEHVFFVETPIGARPQSKTGKNFSPFTVPLALTPGGDAGDSTKPSTGHHNHKVTPLSVIGMPEAVAIIDNAVSSKVFLTSVPNQDIYTGIVDSKSFSSNLSRVHFARSGSNFATPSAPRTRPHVVASGRATPTPSIAPPPSMLMSKNSIFQTPVPLSAVKPSLRGFTTPAAARSAYKMDVPIQTPLAMQNAALLAKISQSISSWRTESHVGDMIGQEKIVFNLEDSPSVRLNIGSSERSPQYDASNLSIESAASQTDDSISESPSMQSAAKKERTYNSRTIGQSLLSSTARKFHEALLDEECALYACRLQTKFSPRPHVSRCTNPVAKTLLEGDGLHFIPIRDELMRSQGWLQDEGSAFCRSVCC